MNCIYCTSDNVVSNGIRKNVYSDSHRYRCSSCKKNFSVPVEKNISVNKNNTKFVITACQNNTKINTNFVKSLSHYCKINNAELLIVPILYQADNYDIIEYNIPDYIKYTLVQSKLKIHDEVYVMGSFNFIPTTVNPLSGLESLSRGDTLIVPSPQLRMKSMAVSAIRHPAILHTTGAISLPEYTNSKSGEKAKFNHSYSAVLVEIDHDNDFHIRVLNSDVNGSIKDIGYKYLYTGHVVHEDPVALVTGDEHAMFACPEVELATYTGEKSIVKVLQPKYVVRHDLLDCFSINHHTRKDNIKNVGRQIFGMNKIEDELATTVDYLLRTTNLNGFTVENIIVGSNHNDHLTQWFSNIDIKTEPWNAKFYHKYMYKILDSLTETPIGFSHIDPFEQFCKDIGVKNTRFLRRDESFKIADVELGSHGDKGANGARGSVTQFSNLSEKYVIGHSHTPGIVSGAYQTGTSSYLKLDYTSGVSSWMNTHCLVYSDGTRQLINIINGKWRA